MNVCKVQKIQGEYYPPLEKVKVSHKRVVKNFKKVKGFETLTEPKSRLNTILKSKLIGSQTYASEETKPYDSQDASPQTSNSSGSDGNNDKTQLPATASIGQNLLNLTSLKIAKSEVEQNQDNSLNDFYIDPECFLLLGLLYCPDPHKQRPNIFYSLLKSKID